MPLDFLLEPPVFIDSNCPGSISAFKLFCRSFPQPAINSRIEIKISCTFEKGHDGWVLFLFIITSYMMFRLSPGSVGPVRWVYIDCYRTFQSTKMVVKQSIHSYGIGFPYSCRGSDRFDLGLDLMRISLSTGFAIHKSRGSPIWLFKRVRSGFCLLRATV